MNKQELISKISQDTGITKAKAAAAVDSFIEGITKSLKKGQPITFVGFGTFKTAQRKARTARNPQTGAAIKDPQAPGRPVQRRQGVEDGGELDVRLLDKGEGDGPFPLFFPHDSPGSPSRRLVSVRPSLLHCLFSVRLVFPRHRRVAQLVRAPA